MLGWIEAIQAPTLVIAADPAPVYFTPAMRDARVARLRDGQLAVIAGGHHLHMEQPEPIGRLVRAFLQAPEPGSRPPR